MGMRGLLRHCIEVPLGLVALVGLAFAWWVRARRSERVSPSA
ncbi:MAG TPA: hypothetical protein VJT31_02205 [Rugosimonospora sp.]|nr:hypothetical protein [Rugosimonospora sp.]